MKCPKCGYTSFDYSQPCPRCNRDISGERKKMNLPSYKPTPFYLLSALLGESGINGDMQEARHKVHGDFEQKTSHRLDDSDAVKDAESKIKVGEGYEETDRETHEKIDFSAFSQQGGEIDLASVDDTEELTVTLDDFVFGDSNTGLREDLETLEDLVIEPYKYPVGSDIPENYEAEEKASPLDLDDISFDEEVADIDGEAFDKAFVELELSSSLEEEQDLDFSAEDDEKLEDDYSIDLDSIDLDLDFEDLDDDSSDT